MKATLMLMGIMQLFLHDSYAQNNKRFEIIQPVDAAELNIHLKGNRLITDTLVLIYWDSVISGFLNTVNVINTGDGQGNYHFKIPVGDLPRKFQISSQNGFLLGRFYTERGDRISVTGQSRDPDRWQLLFSGKGSEKFIYMFALQTEQDRLFAAPHPKQSAKGIKGYDLVRGDSILNARLALLDTYKNAISGAIFTVLKADQVGLLRGESYQLTVAWFKDLNVADKKYRYSLIEKLNREPIDTASSMIMCLSEPYLEMLKWKALATLRMEQDTNLIAPYDVYKKIKAGYDNKLADAVIANYLLAGPPKTDIFMDSYILALQSGLNTISDTTLRRYLSIQLNGFQKGKPAFAFQLPDSAGKMHSLRDYKGKVLLLDYWFTGCGNCEVLAKTLKEDVIPFFNDNPNVVFLSINTDRNEAIWKASIKGGKYTSSHEINLYTEGLELQHPMIRHYNFQGFPQVLIIDANGNIFSSASLRKKEELIAVLERAVKGK